MNRIEVLESYSNLSYLIAGIAGYFLINDPVFLVLCTVLSGGSFIYHKYKIGNIFLIDWFAMIVALVGIAAMLHGSQLAWILAVIYITLYGYFFVGRLNVYVEVGAACLPLVIMLFVRLELWQALTCIGLMLVALMIRRIDNHKNTTDRYYDSLPHTAWHILTGLDLFLIVFFQWKQ